MNRKEFLVVLYSRYLRPIFQISLTLFILWFIKTLIFETENFSLKFLFTIALILSSFIFLISIAMFFLSGIPEKLKKLLNAILTIIYFVSIPIILYAIYLFWEKDKIYIIATITVMIIDRIVGRKSTRILP